RLKNSLPLHIIKTYPQFLFLPPKKIRHRGSSFLHGAWHPYYSKHSKSCRCLAPTQFNHTIHPLQKSKMLYLYSEVFPIFKGFHLIKDLDLGGKVTYAIYRNTYVTKRS